MNDLEFIVLGLILQAGLEAADNAEDAGNEELRWQLMKPALEIRKVCKEESLFERIRRGWGYELWRAPAWSEEDFTFLDGAG